MRAGELRHRVAIERQTTLNGEWGRETSWAPLDSAWASVVAASGNEKFDAKTSGTNDTTRYTVRMRFRDVTTADRLVHDGRVLDITAVVDPDGRGRELVIDCVHNGKAGD